ncbi:MAG: hypothetical protein MUC39_01395 [Candidatus Omnitrophica bacterium]|jgi:type II secretory pathway pseudopilin PulG|nr:hypothetical protein [Candidatus Omnitrophota bacterium]
MKKTTLSKNHGIALLIALGILLFLSIITSASFIRYGAEKNISNRERALMQAFYNAEEGLNYAYGELAQNGYNWQTHTWNGTTLTPTSGITSQFGGSFNNDGLYSISGHHFQVITYLELNKTTKIPTGVTVIHSRATDPQAKVTRTVELRVSKNSLFDYFYFFPNDHTFSGATYDGAGYGKIHVNGRIILQNNPIFKNIIELSTANAANNGYFQLYNFQYSSPKGYDGSTVDGIAPLSRSSAPPYDYYTPSNASYDMYSLARKFTTSNTAASVDGVSLPSTLSQEWSWDKYSGDRADNEQAVSFQVSNDALSWLTTKNGDGAILSGDDYQSFVASPSTFDWDTWKTNNGYTASGSDTTGALARKFWNSWLGNTPSYINDEWWSDLTYGNDRPVSETVNVSYLNTKEQTSAWQSWIEGKTATITKYDADEPETKSLSSVLKDGSNGGQYLVPIKLETNYKKQAENGGIAILKGYSDEYSAWLNQPHELLLATGETVVFTMANFTTMFSNWVATHSSDPLYYLCIGQWYTAYYTLYYSSKPTMYEWQIPEGLEDIISSTLFYNPVRQPGVYDSQNETTRVQNAKPTTILDIDVAKLRDYLQDKGQAFNGVVYVESTDVEDYHYYYDDLSIRVKNAGILPENGLTLVTPHNIIVQGSFNLDYERDKEGKTAAESEAYDYYQENHGGSNSDYKWRPAALISSQRMIYTVSDNFQKDQAISSLADISSYNYWRLGSSGNYPYSLKDSVFVNSYLNSYGGSNAPQAVKDFFAKYPELGNIPGTWTVDNINQYLNTTLYPDAGKAQEALRDAGEGKYDLATEATQPNRVLKDVIYNTAMVSPYEPEGYTLERWIGVDGVTKKRQITGSLIQLEDKYRASVPFAYSIKNQAGLYVYQIGPGYDYNSKYHYGYNSHGYIPQYSGSYVGKSYYNYEPNFAKSSSEGSTSGPIAAAVGSWFEIPNNNFYPEY